VTIYLPFLGWSYCWYDTQISLADLTRMKSCPVMLEQLYSHDPVAKASLVGIESTVCRSVWCLDIRLSIAVMSWYGDMWVLNYRSSTDKSVYNFVLIHPVVFVIFNTN
jgi:hypothetical protein